MAFFNEYDENEFETERLLYAVGNLDAIRYLLADIEPTEPYHVPRPPEIREKLMKLHRLVFNDGFAVSRDTLCQADVMRDEIDSELDQIRHHAEQIQTVLWDLHKALPEFTCEAEIFMQPFGGNISGAHRVVPGTRSSSQNRALLALLEIK